MSYLAIWWNLLAPRRPELLFFDGPPMPVHLLTLMIEVPLAGLVVYFARPRRAYLILMLLPLFALRNCLARVTDAVHPFYWIQHGWMACVVLLVLLAGGIAALARYGGAAARGLPGVLGALFWVFPVFCVQGAWLVTHPHGWGEPRVGDLRAGPGRRVVWVIFDEWDYGLTFGQRPQGLTLPEIDRFAAHAMAATHAYPPGGRTEISIPALLSGQLVSKIQPLGPSAALVTLEPGHMILPIQQLARDGFPDAISGWFYPYGRLFGSRAACFDCQQEGMKFRYGSGFGEVLVNELRGVFETDDFSPFGQSLFVRGFRRCYEAETRQGIAWAAGGRGGFIFLHVPAPHPPYFYDRKTGGMDRAGSGAEGYYDELALADRTLGELRAAMERSGVWDSAAVILSSDHWLRGAPLKGKRTDHRVPFLVKLPGQIAGTVIEESFNTVHTMDLIEAIRGSGVTDAAQWLREHRGRLSESPYNGS